MIKFSYSRINTYNQCPQKYKIQYIDKIYSSKNSLEAFMGKSVHDVSGCLGEFFGNYRVFAEERLQIIEIGVS